MMPSWADYLPDDTQTRAVENEAFAKARGDVATIDALAPQAASDRLAAAAAEAARGGVLVRSALAAELLHLYRPTLVRLLPEAARLANPFGVLAGANGILAGGSRIEHDVLAPEVPVLERHAREGTSSRELAFAALGAARVDLARALSRDPSLLRLAGACETKDAGAFYDFVAAFPTSDVGYAELLFVARAFVVVLEERGREGIGRAASWLRTAVLNGPLPLVPYRPPPPPPPRAPIVPPQVRLGPSPYDWSRIALDDVHGLWGGRAIAISSIGDVEVIVVAGGEVTRRVRGKLDGAALAKLDAVLAHNPVRTIPRPTRLGIPDEAHPSLTLVTDTETQSAWKWAGEANPPFDAIAYHLATIATSLLG